MMVMPLQETWLIADKDLRTVRPSLKVKYDDARDCTDQGDTAVVKEAQQLYDNSNHQDAKNLVKNVLHCAELPLTTPNSRWRTHYQVYEDVVIPLLLALIVLALSIWQIPLQATLHRSDGWLASLIPMAMIIGSSIVHTALAVTTASPRQDSPHFGCGWLSYSLFVLLSAFGSTQDLLPKLDMNCKVINLQSGHSHHNTSWLISRVLRDLELRLVPSVSTDRLCIKVFDVVAPAEPLSWLATIYENATSMVIMSLQLVISVFAICAHHNISVFLLFALCVFLMQTITSLPAWHEQKFPAGKDDGEGAIYALVCCGDARYVTIICNTDPGAWNIEDLALAGQTCYDYVHTLEQPILILIFLSFLAFTVLSTYLNNMDAMYLLVILALGTLGNVLAAASPREPWAHGLNLERVDIISDDEKIIHVLWKLEEKYEGFSEPLIREFFPGGLRLEDELWWMEMRESTMATKVREEEIDKGCV